MQRRSRLSIPTTLVGRLSLGMLLVGALKLVFIGQWPHIEGACLSDVSAAETTLRIKLSIAAAR